MSTHTIAPAGRISSARTSRPPVAPTASLPAVRAGSTGVGLQRSLRLTRRGRVVLVLALLGLLLAAGFTLGRVSSGHASETTATRVVVVQPGQTLWSIAAQVSPHSDTRVVVARLTVMNHLSSASVQVGERLTVPS